MMNGFGSGGNDPNGINFNPKTIVTNIVTEIAPNMTNVVVSAAEGLKDLRDFLNKSRSNMTIQNDQLEQNPLVRSTDREFERNEVSNAIESKGINEELDMITENFDAIMEDFPDFEIPETESDPNMKATAHALRGAEATTRMTAAAASATVSSISKMTKVLAKSQAKTAAYIAKSQSNASLISMSKINTQLIGVNKRLDVLNDNVAKLVEFNNRNIGITNQRFIEHMQMTEKVMEIVVKTQNQAPNVRKYKDDFNLLDYGYIDPSALKDHIKKNAKNTILGTSQLFVDMLRTTILGDGRMYSSTGSSRGGRSVIGQVGNGLVESYIKLLLPTVITKSINTLDKNLFSYMKQTMLSLGDNRSNNPLIGLLGELVGVKPTSRKIRLDKYNKDAMPWNGVDHKYLTEVIPHYLANIEKGVLGMKEARYFDADQGRFFTESDLEKRLKKERERYVYEFDDVARMLSEATDVRREQLASEGANIEQLNATLNQLINERMKSDKNTDPEYANKVKKAFRDNNTNIFDDEMMREFIITLENAIYNGRSRDTRFMNDIQTNINGAGYRNLLVNGERYSDRLQDLDFFKDAQYDRHGRRKQVAPEMDTPEYDEWLRQEQIYQASSMLTDRVEAPARRVAKDVKKVYDKFTAKVPWLSPLLPEFNVSSGQYVSPFLAHNPYVYEQGNAFQQMDRNLFNIVYGGQGVTPETLLNGGRFIRREAGNARDAVRGAATNARENVRSALDRRGRGRRTGDVDVDDVENMSEGQQDQLEAQINGEMEDLGEGGTEEGTVTDAIREQTDVITRSNRASHKIFALNLGKIFGKDGKIAKLLQSDTMTRFRKKVTKFLFGEKGENRAYKDGIFSSIANKFLDGIDYLKFAINGEAYTDRSGKRHAGTKNSVLGFIRKGYDKVFSHTMYYLFGEDYKENETYKKYLSWADLGAKRAKKRREEDGGYSNYSSLRPTDLNAFRRTASTVRSRRSGETEGESVGSGPGDNAEQERAQQERIEAEQETARSIHRVVRRAFRNADTTIRAAVGDDSSARDKEKGALAKFKQFLPKGLTAAGAGAAIPLLAGGNMGLLGSMFLPGGPVGGAILGLSTAIISRSETFQKIVFGEKDQDGNRVGGLVNQKMMAALKKIAPAAIGGAALGLLKSAVFGSAGGPMGILLGSVLPGGIIGTALFGAGTSILMRSEKFNRILFGGREGERGERNLSERLGTQMTGIKNGLKKSMDYVVGGIKGIGAGVVTGAAVSQMGVLGAALGAGGPIGFGIAGLGLGIASQTKKFKEYFWGTEELDENGNPTGKKKNGLVGKFQNYMQLEVFDKLANKAEEATTDLAYWGRSAVVAPINKAFGPLVNGIKDVKEDISDAIHSAFQSVANTITDHTKRVVSKVFSPVGQFMMEKILKPIGRVTLGTVTGVGKAAVGTAMLPVRALGYITGAERKRKDANAEFEADLRAGNIEGFSPDGDLSTEEMIAAKKQWAESKHPERNMSWMWQDEQTKLDRFARRQERDNYRQNAKYDKLRSKFLKADKYDENAEISFRTFEMRKKQLEMAGYDVSGMATADDLRRFMYKRDNQPAAEVVRATEEQAQREESRDQRDESYQRNVVELLTDQVQILSGGEYSRVRRQGTPISSQEAAAMHTSGEEQATIIRNAFDQSITEHSQAQAEAQADAAEDQARRDREAQESRSARELTEEARSEERARKKSLWSQAKDKAKGAVSTVKEKASSIFDWILKNPTQAATAGMIAAVIGPAVMSAAKDMWTNVAWPAIKENAPAFLNKTVGVVKDAAVWGFGKIASGADELWKWARDSFGKLIAGLPGTFTGTIRDIFGKGEDTVGVDENGDIMYDENGNPIMVSGNRNDQLINDGLRFAAGNMVPRGITPGNFYNFRTQGGIYNIGRNAISGVGREIGTGIMDRGFGNLNPLRLVGGSAVRGVKGFFTGIKNGLDQNRESRLAARTASNAADDVARAAGEAATEVRVQDADPKSLLDKAKTILNKIFDSLKSNGAVKKIVSAETLAKIHDNLNGMVDAIAANSGRIGNKILSRLPAGLANFVTRTGTKLIPLAGIGITAGFAVWDATSGYVEAPSLFGVAESDVNYYMRKTSIFMKVLLGFSGLGVLLEILADLYSECTGRPNPMRLVAELVYSAFVKGDEDDLKALDSAQAKFDTKAQAWMEETGNTYDEYVELMNQSGAERLKNTVSNAVTTVKNKAVEIKNSAGKVIQKGVNAVKEGWNYLWNGGKTSVGSGIGYGEGFGVPQMSQYDPRWSGMTLGTNKGSAYNMGQGGCGPTSLAMVANAMGKRVNPGQVGALARDNGYAVSGGSSKDLFTEGASKLGLRSKNVGSSGIESQLKSGHPVILSGKGSGKDTPYTKVGHIVTASGVDRDGNVTVNDPRYSTPSKYPLSKVKQGMKHGWSYDSVGSGDDAFKDSEAVFYRQSDSRWGSKPYGSSTIGRIGCIMTSLAMALSSLTGQTITPATVVDKWGNSHWVKGAGTSWNIMSDAAKDLGLDVKRSLNSREITNAAYNRKPVVMWGKKGPGSIFGNGGSSKQGFHSVIAINGDPNSGNLLINDPGKNKGQNLVISSNAMEGKIKQGYIFSKGGKGIGDIDPSAIANGTPMDTGVNSATSMGDTRGGGAGRSSSGVSGVLAPLGDAITKIGTIAMNDFDKQLMGGNTRGGGAGRDSVGSGEGPTSSVFTGLSNALSQIANIASADVYSKMYGVSYADAKAALANQSQTAGTDSGVNLDPNAAYNDSYTTAGGETNAIANRDLRKFTQTDAASMNSFFKRMNKTSPFNGNGQVFIDASKETGIDPRYIAAHAAWESGWGTSPICLDKNNYFGIGAFDRSPYASAYTFGNGLQNGIMGGAKWISDKYINNGYETLAKMKAKGYATDVNWVNGIASIMKKAPKDPLYNEDGTLAKTTKFEPVTSKKNVDTSSSLLGGNFAFQNTANNSIGSGIDIASLNNEKFGASGVDQSIDNKSISDKLSIALKTDGVENKLDTLIGVVKDIFDVESQRSDSINLSIGSGDTNVTFNNNKKGTSKGKNTTFVVNNKERVSSLRNIHEMIARVTPTPA